MKATSIPTIEPARRSPCCELCRFWLRVGATRMGVCRRYPPELRDQHILPEAFNRQPLTDAPGWCGEFSPSALYDL